MGRVIDSIQRFFIGRNKMDMFAFAAIIAYLVINIINMFFHLWVLTLLAFACFGYSIFRMLSKNIPQRQLENEKFLIIWGRVVAFFKLTKNRFKYIKTHVYKTCPSCKAKIRLPRKKGKHTVCCPKCRKDFKVRILF